GDGERYVDHLRDAAHPGGIEAAALGARRDVVEHQLIGAFLAIAHRMLNDVADIAMIAELHAFDDAAVLHVQAGNDPTRGHSASASSSLILPSHSALPTMAPAVGSPRKSSSDAMPPDACT